MPSKKTRLLILTPLSLCLVWLSAATTASAHNRWVHNKSTEAAYFIMRMAGMPDFVEYGFTRPAEVPDAEKQEWDTFLKRISLAALWLSTRSSELPKPRNLTCWNEGINGTKQMGVSLQQADQMTGPLSGVPFAIINDYLTASPGCGLSPQPYHPGGIFDKLTRDASGNVIDKTGNVLGMWTANVDTAIDDVHLMVRLSNLPGFKQVKDSFDEGYKAGAEPAFVPVYCAIKCIASLFGFGSCGDCIKGAKKIVDDKDPVKAADNLIPGIGVEDFTDGQLVGLFHHMKAHGPHSDTYDVAQGYLTDEAHLGDPGPMELVSMVLMDISGMTVDYEKSQGTAKYQIYGAGDGHPDSVKRGAEDWQWSTLPHTPFSPVDNLGQYGWAKFRDLTSHSVVHLGYALHAIDDSSTPPHIAGTFGWGHSPFEDAEEQLWPLTMWHDLPNYQYRLINQILSMAYSKYLWIKKWRQDHGGTTDVPFRILADDLARATSKLIDASPSKPFSLLASEQKFLGGEEAAREVFTEDPPLLDMVIRPATAMGLAVKIAFLLAAVERIAPDKVLPW